MNPIYHIPTFLPGALTLCRGAAADYRELARFHYRGRGPAAFADVWVIRFLPHCADADQLIAVAALSYPIPALHARDRALGLAGMDDARKLAFLNQNLRTISRVAVHPTFRSLGLARLLVRCLIHHSPVRYLESLAVMGRIHPFFELAGMRACAPGPVAAHQRPRPWYYLFDRACMRVDWDLRRVRCTNQSMAMVRGASPTAPPEGDHHASPAASPPLPGSPRVSA